MGRTVAFRIAKYYLIYDGVHMGHNRSRISTIFHDLEEKQEGNNHQGEEQSWYSYRDRLTRFRGESRGK